MSFQLNLWQVGDDVEYVNVVVYRNDETTPHWFNPQVHVDSFPLTISVQGTGLANFRIYSVENGNRVPRASEPIDFGLPANND